jgi:myo-inositol-1-phosphate synthase
MGPKVAVRVIKNGMPASSFVTIIEEEKDNKDYFPKGVDLPQITQYKTSAASHMENWTLNREAIGLLLDLIPQERAIFLVDLDWQEGTYARTKPLEGFSPEKLKVPI